MLDGLTFQADGSAFARAAHNALAHVPARANRFPYGRLIVAADRVFVTGTDGYTIGHASCPYERPPAALAAPLVVCVSRAGLTELDKLGRAAGGPVEVRVRPEAIQVMSAYGGDDGGLVMCDQVTPDMTRLWEACDDLLSGWVTHRPMLPELLGLDPVLWSRFSKIKVHTRKLAMADILITDPNEPVLVKIGPDFMGVIMPVDREVARNAESRGAEYLW